jgi:hypothetical protein
MLCFQIVTPRTCLSNRAGLNYLTPTNRRTAETMSISALPFFSVSVQLICSCFLWSVCVSLSLPAFFHACMPSCVIHHTMVNLLPLSPADSSDLLHCLLRKISFVLRASWNSYAYTFTIPVSQPPNRHVCLSTNDHLTKTFIRQRFCVVYFSVCCSILELIACQTQKWTFVYRCSLRVWHCSSSLSGDWFVRCPLQPGKSSR